MQMNDEDILTLILDEAFKIHKAPIVEAKNVATIAPIDIAQLLMHLRFLHLRKGLILNFNSVLLKEGIKRVINGYP